MQFARDGRTLYYKQGPGIYSVAIATNAGGDGQGLAAIAGRGGRGGAAAAAPATGTGRRLTFTVRHETDQRALNHQVFNESWRIMKYRFYDAKMNGVDWDQMKLVYEPLVSYVSEREEMQDIVNMMIGELNASHTGLSGGGRTAEAVSRVSTRHPGFELTPDQSGFYKVDHVYKQGTCRQGLDQDQARRFRTGHRRTRHQGWRKLLEVLHASPGHKDRIHREFQAG